MMQLEPAVSCRSRRVDRTLITGSNCLFGWCCPPTGEFSPASSRIGVASAGLWKTSSQASKKASDAEDAADDDRSVFKAASLSQVLISRGYCPSPLHACPLLRAARPLVGFHDDVVSLIFSSGSCTCHSPLTLSYPACGLDAKSGSLPCIIRLSFSSPCRPCLNCM